MAPYTLPLSDPAASLETAGGKGMSLALLLRAGLPVPPGFHVTTTAYQRFVAANDIQPRILACLQDLNASDPAALESASRQIGGFFSDGQIPPEIAGAITSAYAALNSDIPVAVRSSATAEDLPGASFAGQQETFLNISGPEAVIEAVQRCWASLWTARAIAYRMKQGIDSGSVALAVVVQEMVPAHSAGILFTANPTNGRRNELIINAAWGLGEAIVSGAVTPDTITVEKSTGKVLRRQVAEKQVKTVLTPQGTTEQPVPDSLKKKPVLSSAEIKALTRLGVQIEQLYQTPMDIEWALAGGKFAILQARPITALPEPPLEWTRPDPKAIYARGSLAEHTPAPITPLFATLGLEIANVATQQMWDSFLGEKDAARLIAIDGFYKPINGYMYGGIRFGAKDLLPVLRMSIRQIGPVVRFSMSKWQAACQELSRVVAEWKHRPVEALSPAELLDGVRTLFGAACHYFTEIQTALPAASSSEILFTRLYNSLIRRKPDPPATTFLLGFNNTALNAEKSLYDLAMWIQGDPDMNAYITGTPTADILLDLEQLLAPDSLSEVLWAGWRQRFQTHLDEYAHTAYEFDFANPTPADAPGPILDAIKAYLSGKAQNPYERQRQAVEKREQATQAVLKRVGWPRKAWFQKLLHWAQETGPMREDSIFDMGMAHPLIRRLLLELGRRFAEVGAISQADHIFWLEKAEVEELVAALENLAALEKTAAVENIPVLEKTPAIENSRPLPDFSTRIPERKDRWQATLKISPPVMLPERSGWQRMIHGGEATERDGKIVLRGVGTSGGTVTAPACVVYGAEDFGRLKPGDVLVAVTTTPAWTSLFSLASAVVTDIGGPLSHSSIVAREYGIPAVMAARGATRAIQSGCLVTVDGNAGTVTIEP